MARFVTIQKLDRNVQPIGWERYFPNLDSQDILDAVAEFILVHHEEAEHFA